MTRPTDFTRSLSSGEPRLTAAIPMENPHCSCRLTRVRSVLATLLLVVVYVTTSVVAYATVGGGVAGFLPR